MINELRHRDPLLFWIGAVMVLGLIVVTLLSIGVPMIVMGDEARRTQHGNNNAYCHDNELSWFDWTLVARHADVHRFVTLLNERRLMRSVEHEHRRLTLDDHVQQSLGLVTRFLQRSTVTRRT